MCGLNSVATMWYWCACNSIVGISSVRTGICDAAHGKLMQGYGLMIKIRIIVLILMAIMAIACGRQGPLYLPEQKPEKLQQTLDKPESNEKTQKRESK